MSSVSRRYEIRQDVTFLWVCLGIELLSPSRAGTFSGMLRVGSCSVVVPDLLLLLHSAGSTGAHGRRLLFLGIRGGIRPVFLV